MLVRCVCEKVLKRFNLSIVHCVNIDILHIRCIKVWSKCMFIFPYALFVPFWIDNVFVSFLLFEILSFFFSVLCFFKIYKSYVMCFCSCEFPSIYSRKRAFVTFKCIFFLFSVSVFGFTKRH